MKVFNKIRMISILYFVCIFIAAFWPFDLKVRESQNNVGWKGNENGIKIAGRGLIYSKNSPRRIAHSLISSNSITIETLISTDLTKTDPQKSSARIVSYSVGFHLRNFTLGQDNTSLVFRIRTLESDANGLPEIRAENVLKPNKKYYITATYNGKSAKLYLNGRLVKLKSYENSNLKNWSKDYFLVLGNEIIGNRPWSGEICYLAIHNRALSANEVFQNFALVNDNTETMKGSETSLIALYTFDEIEGNIIFDKSKINPALNLYIPEKFRVSNIKFPRLSVNDFKNRLYVTDAFINVFGFIPLSFVLFFILKDKMKSFLLLSIIIITAGFLASVTIEVVQTYSMERFATTFDIIYNTLGVIIGYSFLFFYRQRIVKGGSFWSQNEIQ